MVHSSSASPMKTTPLASPHLTVPATTPPLQADSSQSPSGDISEKDQTQTPDTCHTKGLPSNSELTLACSLSPTTVDPTVVTLAKVYAAVDAAPTFVAVAKPLDTNLTPASPAVTPSPSQGPLNGRTSSRKRTPKACDCCGHNSKAHNVRAAGRGRGRGRGRGKAGSSEVFDTPKRNEHDQQNHVKCLNWPNETVREIECEGYANEKVQMTKMTILVADGTGRNEENKDYMSVGGSLMDGIEGQQDGEDVLMPSGVADWGRGEVGVTPVAKMEVKGGRRGGCGADMKNCKTNVLPQVAFVQTHGLNRDAEMDHIVSDWSSDKSAENGDTVSLSDTEPEEEAKGGAVNASGMENGLPPYLGPPLSTRDLDTEMQVDLHPDEINSPSSVSVSNGSGSAPTNVGLPETHMEVQAAQSDPHAPMTISIIDHLWALRDHGLYCLPGTWEKDLERASGPDGRQTEVEEESREHLIDLIHEFLESFYIKYGSFIPLSQADVLEYLKKNGNSDLSHRSVDLKGEIARYRAGLASAPVAGFMVMYNKHSLSLEDLGTLEEQNWINDQIINMYGELIMEKTQHKVDLFSKTLLLFPIHLEIHWSLITVTMETKTISYYDSQGIVFRHTTDNIMKYLLSEAKEKEQTAFQKGWKISIIKGIPHQKNDSDCGVFVLEYCRRLSMKQPLHFSQEDMPGIRKRIYKELCDYGLND
ncbi:Sentrin-specific protease 5 [Takifugu flavidus]|uniref:Sentrin-specific protease 5 n=1 Tax=Takifugu flavidus TaxID=433684 RepID=A0A5C6MXL0_9TELE|nr:Sentrin-specific protease 5 [Takifugu flavidus]